MNKNLLIIGAGSEVNHCSMCSDGVHLESNATVADNTIVPAGKYIDSGAGSKRDKIEVNDLFFNAEEWRNKSNEVKKPHGHFCLLTDWNIALRTECEEYVNV